jgi:hypothetical protein
MHVHTVVPTEMFDLAINTSHTDQSDRYNCEGIRVEPPAVQIPEFRYRHSNKHVW